MANRTHIGIELTGTAEAPTSSITISDNYATGYVDLGEASPAEVAERLSPAQVVATVLDHGDSDAIDLIYYANGAGAPVGMGSEQLEYDSIDWSRIEDGN